jgi:L-2-amino-thiazoline-4-carboxylic acid hydrolase
MPGSPQQTRDFPSPSLAVRKRWHDYFDRHGAGLLATVMCSWDTNWMRAIDPAVSGLRAERTSLLWLGDDQCRFAMLGTDDPLAGYADKLGQRFAGKQESG